MSGISLQDLDGKWVELRKMQKTDIMVFIFMSPDCPLCINYTHTIRDLILKFGTRGVQFIPVYPGEYFTKAEIEGFQSMYDFEMESLLDPDFKLAGLLEATVTPEAVVISADGIKKYSGAIDNWMYETGKKNSVITKKYLEEALTRLLNGKDPEPEKTQPFGCFIEL